MKKIKGNIVDVLKREIFFGEIIFDGNRIVDINRLEGEGDNFIVSGLVDSHVHIESSMMIPVEFAKAVVKFGFVSTVSDPHEIANVLGVEGVKYMLDNASKVDFKFHFGIPSCVPATFMETSGAIVAPDDVEQLMKENNIVALAEVMNFPGVINGDKDLRHKIDIAKKHGKIIDGHAPGLMGENLDKYAKAGISTDHECFTYSEAIEKIKRGMKIQIREGSAAKNFDSLKKLFSEYPNEVMLCTDDAHPDDILDGYLLKTLRKAVKEGINIFDLLQALTVNPVRHYKLDVGLLQKDDFADFVVFDNLTDLNVLNVYSNGKEIYANGKVDFSPVDKKTINNFFVNEISEKDLKVKNKGKEIKVIGVIDGELVTQKQKYAPLVVDDYIVSDVDRDILKIVVLNRYQKSSPQIAFIKGFGLKYGAIASSIAHDSHNIICIGVDDESILKAINRIQEIKGGIAVYDDRVHDLKLPVAGIMSTEPVEYLAEQYKLLSNKAKNMGSNLHAPFMTLSFMALLVIPSLKIGDKGLFDVDAFQLVDMYD